MTYRPDPSIADVKARADILTVLEELGAKVAPEGGWDEEVRVFCPFCVDLNSKKPAGRANSLRGLYFCFACGTGGDVIKLVMIGKGLDFTAALHWLDAKFPGQAEDPWSTT